METTDNTLLEMQQQMKQLREKLESQKIINERILRKSCGRTIDRLRFKSNVPIFAGAAGLALIPFLHHQGFSNLLLIVTGVLMIAGISATLITKQYIPNLDKDLVSATTELTKFRRINADWIKYGLPALFVWLGVLIWDVASNHMFSGSELYGFIAGASVGLVIGLILGLKNRRDILNASDDLLSQIEDLKKN
ncbi:MAG: YtxH domain-containing protein [Bacteroidales bacterium]|nr:YtxH domain-containing protein [Bacteroidales bacterium]